MGALYGYLYPTPVALYVAAYLVMATYYFFAYIIRRRNLFIASRCPDMLVVDLLSQSAVVIVNGSALIATAHGHAYPCWAIKFAFSLFAFNTHIVTIMRSMKLLYAFDKNVQWLTACGTTARRRLAAVAVGNVAALALFILLNYYPACTDLCRHDNCPWTSDWIIVWFVGAVWMPVLESLSYALGKAGADSDLLGMHTEVSLGLRVIAPCMISSGALTMALDMGWVSGKELYPIPGIIWISLSGVQFAITHLVPSVYLGYAPHWLMLLTNGVRRTLSGERPTKSDASSLLQTTLRAHRSRTSIVVPVNELDLPVDTNGQPVIVPFANDSYLVNFGNVQAAGDTGPMPAVRRSQCALNAIPIDAMQPFLLAICNDEQRKEQLLKRARLFLAEEAMAFAVGLATIEQLPKTGDSREQVRVSCKALLDRHIGAAAPWRIEISPGAEQTATHEIYKLMRRKVLFADDLNAAIKAFEPARLQLEFRLRQVAWEFTQEEAIATADGLRLTARRRSSSNSNSNSSSTSTSARASRAGEDAIGTSRRRGTVEPFVEQPGHPQTVNNPIHKAEEAKAAAAEERRRSSALKMPTEDRAPPSPRSTTKQDPPTNQETSTEKRRNSSQSSTPTPTPEEAERRSGSDNDRGVGTPRKGSSKGLMGAAGLSPPTEVEAGPPKVAAEASTQGEEAASSDLDQLSNLDLNMDSSLPPVNDAHNNKDVVVGLEGGQVGGAELAT